MNISAQNTADAGSGANSTAAAPTKAGGPGIMNPRAAAALPLSSDHRFAMLTARAGLEPELAKRYTSDPVSVLAEFGLGATEPVYGDMFAGADKGLVIDYLDRPGTATLYGCYSGMAPLPGEEAQAAFA